MLFFLKINPLRNMLRNMLKTKMHFLKIMQKPMPNSAILVQNLILLRVFQLIVIPQKLNQRNL
nr:L-ascorbate peroxidase S, chloroplastic/mitochondrial-like isoform X3 [Ipomoea batatas]